MKKLFFSFFILMLFLFINQAADAMGLFYTNATYPISATGVETLDITKLKKGSSSTNNILFIVEVGDASIDEAVKKAGISKISYIDMNEKSVFIFWRQLTVNVYGE